MARSVPERGAKGSGEPGGNFLGEENQLFSHVWHQKAKGQKGTKGRGNETHGIFHTPGRKSLRDRGRRRIPLRLRPSPNPKPE